MDQTVFENPSLSTNKIGQTIGRKGATTRQRLIDAALILLKSGSASTLTALAITKAAKTAPATFYVYFADVKELLFAAAESAADGFKSIDEILARSWDRANVRKHVEEFILAFSAVWDRHREILMVQNFEADAGDRRFIEARTQIGYAIAEGLADQIMAAWDSGKGMTRDEAMSRAIVVYCAVERLAVVALGPKHIDLPVSQEQVLKAEIDIITMLLGRDPASVQNAVPRPASI
jgi:AcrR family transcriptional regulator